MSVGAILLCAGRGERLGLGVPKALAPLAGRALFTWSLEALERSVAIHSIVLVGSVGRLEKALAGSGVVAGKVSAWTEGGRERHESVAKGIEKLPENVRHVAVHDCARALVTPELVSRVTADALAHGAAIAAVPVSDTLKRATLSTVEDTVPRAQLWSAQTPQVFRRDWLEAAHASARQSARPGTTLPPTDDAALVEAIGHPVHLTLGDTLNLKITTPQDLALAEAWLVRAAART